MISLASPCENMLSSGLRGGLSIMSGSPGSIPRAMAGRPSWQIYSQYLGWKKRNRQTIIMDKNMVSTSPTLQDSRYLINFLILE